MFATLLGGLPGPPADPADPADPVLAAVRAQEAAGLEPITDGRLGPERLFEVEPWSGAGGDALAVRAWRRAAGMTDRAVKQALPGPYSLGRDRAGDAATRRTPTLELAARLRVAVAALAAAGCPLVEIEETAIESLAGLEAERDLFREAHDRLAAAIEGIHLSLSIVGGSPAATDRAVVLQAPYASLAVDLIAGSDNWHLVAAAARERGIVAGALAADPGLPDGPDVLLYALGYAASTAGRGPDRVGLGTGGGLEALDWPTALVKLERLGNAVRLAARPPGDVAAQLDPRAVSRRAAAMGRIRPRPDARRGR